MDSTTDHRIDWARIERATDRVISAARIGIAVLLLIGAVGIGGAERYNGTAPSTTTGALCWRTQIGSPAFCAWPPTTTDEGATR